VNTNAVLSKLIITNAVLMYLVSKMHELSGCVTEFIQQNFKYRISSIFCPAYDLPKWTHSVNISTENSGPHRGCKIVFIQHIYHNLIHKKTRLTPQTYLCFVMCMSHTIGLNSDPYYEV
jgi:hypothetical protein